MPNVALIPRAATRIDALIGVVDGYPETVHEIATRTGGAPLEDGRDITDHAVATEDKLTLTGFVSDWRGGHRPAEAWEAIRSLHSTLSPVRVVTEWGVYPEMLIRRCQANQAGRGLEFELKLEQVIRVGSAGGVLPSDQLAGPAEGRSGIVNLGRTALQNANRAAQAARDLVSRAQAAKRQIERLPLRAIDILNRLAPDVAAEINRTGLAQSLQPLDLPDIPDLNLSNIDL